MATGAGTWKNGWRNMSKKRPRIGVTGPDSGGTASWLFTALIILLEGGIPVRIRPGHPRHIGLLNGIVLGGGADIDPMTYEDQGFLENYLKDPEHNVRHHSIWKRISRFLLRMLYPFVFLIRRLLRAPKPKFGIDKERDKMEFNVISHAVAHGLPVLGICRGMQLINVFFKGDLYQEIKPFYLEEINKHSILPYVKIFVERRSRLYSILQCHALKVNALHHQAVRQPGRDIDIVAWEINGLVQAIESVSHDFIIGVQWHPEYLITHKPQRRLFKALVAKGREKANKLSS
jgi:putative glutamine amidotransferase